MLDRVTTIGDWFNTQLLALQSRNASIVAGGMVIANKRERAVRFFYCALAVAMLMALVGIYIQFKTGDFRRWSQLDGTGRVYLAFGHTVVNGAGIAFCIGLFSRVGSVRQVLGTMMFATCCFFLLVRF